MWGAPHRGSSRLICRIKSRTSRETAGRPGLPRRTFQVQNRRKPWRCHAITVSGRTMASAARQFGQTRDKTTHKLRSARRQARPWDRPFQDVELVAEGEVLQFQCEARAEGRPKNGEESWQDRHRKRVAPRRVNSIISSCSEFPVGTVARIQRRYGLTSRYDRLRNAGMLTV